MKFLITFVYTNARPQRRVTDEQRLVRVSSDCTVLRAGEELKQRVRLPALVDGTLLGVDLNLKVNWKPLALCAYSDHVLLIK